MNITLDHNSFVSHRLYLNYVNFNSNSGENLCCHMWKIYRVIYVILISDIQLTDGVYYICYCFQTVKLEYKPLFSRVRYWTLSCFICDRAKTGCVEKLITNIIYIRFYHCRCGTLLFTIIKYRSVWLQFFIVTFRQIKQAYHNQMYNIYHP